jgi:hypothetical protein
MSVSAELILLAGVLGITGWLSRKDTPLLGYWGCCICAIVFFSLANTLMFNWYFVWFSLVPILFIPVAVSRIPMLPARYKFPRIAMYAVVVAVCLFGQYRSYPDNDAVVSVGRVAHPFLAWDASKQRLLLYQKAAEYLNKTTSGQGLVGVSEDGMFGYVYRGPVLTLDGLASKEAVKFYPLAKAQYSTPFAISPSLVEKIKPPFVVFLDAFGRNSILKDPFFLATYRRERFWPLNLWGGEGMYLYHDLTADRFPK